MSRSPPPTSPTPTLASPPWTSPPPPPPPVPTNDNIFRSRVQHHILDDEGELTLLVGAVESSLTTRRSSLNSENPAPSDEKVKAKPKIIGCSIQVSRRTMALSSPVWRAMFQASKWAESASKEIALPDDDPEALLLLMRIAHLQFDMVPKIIAKQDTVRAPGSLCYRLALLCDKYDCVNLVTPWLRGWLDGWSPQPNFVIEDLFICWTFGIKDTFKRLMVDLVLQSRLNSDGELVGRDGGRLNSEFTPPGALQRVEEIRRTALRNINTTCRSYMEKYTKGNTQCRYANAEPYRKVCDAAVFGSLVMGLYEYVSLHPTADDDEADHSLEDVQNAIGNLKIYTASVDSHPSCDIARQLKTACDKVVKLPQFLTDGQIEHLTKQAARCGSNEFNLRKQVER